MMRDSWKIAPVAVVAAVAFNVPTAATASGLATCPPRRVIDGNLAENASFEDPHPEVFPGQQACSHNGNPARPASAADHWFMYGSRNGTTVCSRMIESTAPSPNGSRMLRIAASSDNAGVYQKHILDPGKGYMLSAWVLVRRGKVGIRFSRAADGPTAWTTRLDEWEQLRICASGLSASESILIFNQDPGGGIFHVDGVELREIPATD
jgi:hypothetical protein